MSLEKNTVLTVLAAREHLYLLFTSVFGQYPSWVLFDILDSEETIGAVDLFLGDSAADSLRTASSRWNRRCCSDEKALEDLLRAEYMRAMEGPGKLIAYPWESSYQKNAALIFQEKTLEIREAFRKYGLQLQKDTNVPEDHIAFELLFMSEMGKRSSDALDTDDYNSFHTLVSQQIEFHDLHILTWIPKYCKDISALPDSIYIVVLAQLLSSFLEEDRKVLEEFLEISNPYDIQAGLGKADVH